MTRLIVQQRWSAVGRNLGPKVGGTRSQLVWRRDDVDYLSGACARGTVGRSSSTLPGAARRALHLSGGASEPTDALLQATYACNELSAIALQPMARRELGNAQECGGRRGDPAFGAKADELVADALDKFEADAPKGDADVTALYAASGEELKSALLSSLEPVFAQQICLLKDAAMEQFKKGLLGDGDGSEALAAARRPLFARRARACLARRAGASSSSGRALWARCRRSSPSRRRRRARSCRPPSRCRPPSYLQMQQQQMQALQAQYTGGHVAVEQDVARV